MVPVNTSVPEVITRAPPVPSIAPANVPAALLRVKVFAPKATEPELLPARLITVMPEPLTPLISKFALLLTVLLVIEPLPLMLRVPAVIVVLPVYVLVFVRVTVFAPTLFKLNALPPSPIAPLIVKSWVPPKDVCPVNVRLPLATPVEPLVLVSAPTVALVPVPIKLRLFATVYPAKSKVAPLAIVIAPVPNALVLIAPPLITLLTPALSVPPLTVVPPV